MNGWLMMKPDTDIDTEKHSDQNYYNNMFIKTFPGPGNMKNMGNCVFKKKFQIILFHPKIVHFHPKTVNLHPLNKNLHPPTVNFHP